MADPIELEPCIVCGVAGVVEHTSTTLGRWWSCGKDSRTSYELRQLETAFEEQEAALPTP